MTEQDDLLLHRNKVESNQVCTAFKDEADEQTGRKRDQKFETKNEMLKQKLPFAQIGTQLQRRISLDMDQLQNKNPDLRTIIRESKKQYESYLQKPSGEQGLQRNSIGMLQRYAS